MNNLIIVEGETDKYFIEALINNQKFQNIEVGEPICTLNEFNCLGGKDKLKIKLTDIKLDEYDKIGIILDADEDGITQRVNFINEALKSICRDVTLDKINQLKKSDTLDLSIACYIMNVDGKGELETVMRKVSLEDSIYADCLDAWRDCLFKYLFKKNPNYQKPKEMTNARQKFAGATSSFKGF